MVSTWVTMSRFRPVCSWTSIIMNGSSRAPNRDDVRRTPFATARTLPFSRVSMVTIRSASPSLWVRSTMASSRYRLTARSPPCRCPSRYCRADRPPDPGASACGAVHGGDDRLEARRGDRRFDADAPEHVVADCALDVCRRGRVAALGERVLVVVQHRDVDPVARERVHEGRDRAVPGALQGHRGPGVGQVDREAVRTVLGAHAPGPLEREPAPLIELAAGLDRRSE